MKSRWFVAKGFGLLFLALWFVFWGLSLGRSFLNLPIKDPTYWLLGEQFSALALTTLNVGILFVPLLVLLIFLIPSLQVKPVSTGNEVLQIRVFRISKVQLFIVSTCGIITLVLWSVIFFSRLGWL